jgi:hypothetical protein
MRKRVQRETEPQHERFTKNEISGSTASLTMRTPLFMIEMRGGAVW